ncbi:hypothetical protein D3C85_1664060 [compost metagenome]
MSVKPVAIQSPGRLSTDEYSNTGVGSVFFSVITPSPSSVLTTTTEVSSFIPDAYVLPEIINGRRQIVEIKKTFLSVKSNSGFFDNIGIISLLLFDNTSIPNQR